MRPAIRTIGRRYFHFDQHSKYNEPDFYEIAVGLGNACRFAGQVEEFYSVAQHSVLASYIVPQPLAYEALMHDWLEAYIHDITSPLKRSPEMVGYRALERRLSRELNRKLGLAVDMPFEVHQADLVMLATEKRDLTIDHDEDDGYWAVIDGVNPADFVIQPWPPKLARQRFMERLTELRPDYERTLHRPTFCLQQ